MLDSFRKWHHTFPFQHGMQHPLQEFKSSNSKFHEVITMNSSFTILLQFIKCKCVCEEESCGAITKERNTFGYEIQIVNITL